jgi:hypothetical protein
VCERKKTASSVPCGGTLRAIPYLDLLFKSKPSGPLRGFFTVQVRPVLPFREGAVGSDKTIDNQFIQCLGGGPMGATPFPSGTPRSPVSPRARAGALVAPSPAPFPAARGRTKIAGPTPGPLRPPLPRTPRGGDLEFLCGVGMSTYPPLNSSSSWKPRPARIIQNARPPRQDPDQQPHRPAVAFRRRSLLAISRSPGSRAPVGFACSFASSRRGQINHKTPLLSTRMAPSGLPGRPRGTPAVSGGGRKQGLKNKNRKQLFHRGSKSFRSKKLSASNP